MAADKCLIVEGRIVEFRLHTRIERRAFLVTIDIEHVWTRAYPPRTVEDWVHELQNPRWGGFPSFEGDPSLATPGLKPGDHARLVVRVDGDERRVLELAVLHPETQRYALHHADEARPPDPWQMAGRARRHPTDDLL